MSSQHIVPPTPIIQQLISQVCSLCGFTISGSQIVSCDQVFCCHGCLAVYQILDAKHELHQKSDHPLLHQAVTFGLITNPALIESIQKQESTKATTKERWVIEIGEMWCPFCAELIHLALGSQKGVILCHVDYITDLATLDFDPCKVSKKKIQEWIEALGYTVLELQDKQDQRISKSLMYRFAFASFAALNVMMFTYPLYATYFDINLEEIQPLFAYVSLMFTLPAMGYSGYPIFKRMKNQLKEGRLGMETLVGLATLAACLLSFLEILKGTYHVYFDTITVLIAFLLFGKIIESQAKFSTKSALTHLHHALPKKGRKVFEAGQTLFVPIKEITPGDQILVLTGEKIVLDGEVIGGEGYCDESLITGEAKPVKKLLASKVLAGTIMQKGHITYRVTSDSLNSTLNTILNLVEKEVGGKSVFISPLERLMKGFTPLVVAVACFTFLASFALSFGFDQSIERALALLLIACPCAIGIATPLVESRLLHQFAQMGAIVRNRRIFTTFPKITHFIFDKTGTLTKGVFSCLGLESMTRKNILKGLASKSRHPIAQAVSCAISEEASELTDIQEIAGRGMCGKIGKQEYFFGSYQFLLEKGLQTSLIGDVYFFSSDQVIGSLQLKDQLRPDAYEALQNLSHAQRIVLSGDNARSVQALANVLPLDEWKGECSPLVKQEYIAHLQKAGACVAMIGDGINDSPALAKADMGISMVSATDISIQVSDLLLTKQQLTLIPILQRQACRGSKIIQQNLFWAFAYNGVGMILAISGHLTPLFASFAMIMSSLMVIGNAQRFRLKNNRSLSLWVYQRKKQAK